MDRRTDRRAGRGTGAGKEERGTCSPWLPSPHREPRDHGRRRCPAPKAQCLDQADTGEVFVQKRRKAGSLKVNFFECWAGKRSMRRLYKNCLRNVTSNGRFSKVTAEAEPMTLTGATARATAPDPSAAPGTRLSADRAFRQAGLRGPPRHEETVSQSTGRGPSHPASKWQSQDSTRCLIPKMNLNHKN